MSETTLLSFNGTPDGSAPQGGLALDSAGDIFGTTTTGGIYGYGTVFEITASGTYSVLYSFNTGGSGGGALPYGNIILDSAGNLYGTTYEGGAYGYGTVFEIAAGSTSLTVLHNFTGLTDGGHLYGGLALDAAGNLYGTTNMGGAGSSGTVFEIAASTHSFTTLTSFSGTDGDAPYAGVTLDAAGDIFGTTEYGGTSNDGTVFEIKAGTTTITTLYSFSGADGKFPTASVTLDAAGNIFGTTESGGTGSSGTVFEIAAGTVPYFTTLYNFSGGSDGGNPYAGVTLDGAGTLFGTTESGGTYGAGTAYEIKAGTLTTLYSFSGTGSDGGAPYSGLTLDGTKLLGTASTGGTGSSGTVFEIQAACYYPGTLIATPQGPRAVETLAIGDLVLTHDGLVCPIRWIGRNTVHTRFGDPNRILPVRLKAGCLAEGLPTRDLLLSPDHALLVEDILIQAGALVNGVSILRERNVPARFTYYHIELAHHALLLAEGTPAESFVDNLHRMAFDNWEEHEALYGDAPIEELGLPRAKSHRQVPRAIQTRLMRRSGHAGGHADGHAA